MADDTLSSRLRRIAALVEACDRRQELEEAARDAERLEAEVRHLRTVAGGRRAAMRHREAMGRATRTNPQLVSPEDEERRGGVPGLESDD